MRMCVLILLWFALPPGANAQGSLAGAKAEVERLIAESKAEVVGLAVYDLETKQSLLINEKASLHAASTMKLPVMMEIFQLADRKKLSLNEPIEIKNKFYSIVDGSEYRLSMSDDSDQEIYNRLGQTMTVIELIDRMITWSSNLATNLLIEKVKAENVNALMRELGAGDIQVLRGVEDPKAFQAGKNNTTTAYDLMLLLRLIAENKFLNKRACEKMVEILSAQRFGLTRQAWTPATPPATTSCGRTTWRRPRFRQSIFTCEASKEQRPSLV